MKLNSLFKAVGQGNEYLSNSEVFVVIVLTTVDIYKSYFRALGCVQTSPTLCAQVLSSGVRSQYFRATCLSPVPVPASNFPARDAPPPTQLTTDVQHAISRYWETAVLQSRGFILNYLIKKQNFET